MHTFNITDSISDINCPVQLLCGANDIFFSVEDGIDIKEAIGENA